MRRSILGFAFVVLAGCTPSPVVPSPAGSCAQACAALLTAHCPEGAPADCATTLQHINDDGLSRTPSGDPLTCASVALAQTPAQAREAGVACGSPASP